MHNSNTRTKTIKKKLKKCKNIFFAYSNLQFTYNIHSTYIAEIKRKYGVDMQAKRLIDDAKHVNCPKEKADAIIDALKHFNII